MSLRPPWIEVAESLIGTKEVSGSGNNQKILDWAKLYGGWTSDYYKRDSIPWCGLFLGHCLGEVGIKPINDGLRAKAWIKFGKRLKEPAFGCIIIFTRQGGGHVGFYISEDSNYFHVLGGNQSDMVNITKVAKSRLYGYTWPTGEQYDKFFKSGRIRKSFNGRVSENEA